MSDVFIDEKEEVAGMEEDGVDEKKDDEVDAVETEEKQSIARAGLL